MKKYIFKKKRIEKNSTKIIKFSMLYVRFGPKINSPKRGY